MVWGREFLPGAAKIPPPPQKFWNFSFDNGNGLYIDHLHLYVQIPQTHHTAPPANLGGKRSNWTHSAFCDNQVLLIRIVFIIDSIYDKQTSLNAIKAFFNKNTRTHYNPYPHSSSIHLGSKTNLGKRSRTVENRPGVVWCWHLLMSLSMIL